MFSSSNRGNDQDQFVTVIKEKYKFHCEMTSLQEVTLTEFDITETKSARGKGISSQWKNVIVGSLWKANV